MNDTTDPKSGADEHTEEWLAVLDEWIGREEADAVFTERDAPLEDVRRVKGLPQMIELRAYLLNREEVRPDPNTFHPDYPLGEPIQREEVEAVAGVGRQGERGLFKVRERFERHLEMGAKAGAPPTHPEWSPAPAHLHAEIEGVLAADTSPPQLPDAQQERDTPASRDERAATCAACLERDVPTVDLPICEECANRSGYGFSPNLILSPEGDENV